MVFINPNILYGIVTRICIRSPTGRKQHWLFKGAVSAGVAMATDSPSVAIGVYFILHFAAWEIVEGEIVYLFMIN